MPSNNAFTTFMRRGAMQGKLLRRARNRPIFEGLSPRRPQRELYADIAQKERVLTETPSLFDRARRHVDKELEAQIGGSSDISRHDYKEARSELRKFRREMMDDTDVKVYLRLRDALRRRAIEARSLSGPEKAKRRMYNKSFARQLGILP